MNDISTKTIGALLEAQTLLATVSGPAASTVGMEGLISVIARVGTPGNGTGTLGLQIQTSPDGSTGWVNLGPPLGAFTTAGGTAVQNVNPASSLGFIRCSAATGGATPTFPVAGIYIAAPQYH